MFQNVRRPSIAKVVVGDGSEGEESDLRVRMGKKSGA